MKLIPHSRPLLGQQEFSGIKKILKNGMIASGDEVASFQNEMSSFMGLRRAVAVSSGTAALYLALRALKIKENDEVIIPSYTCTAVINAVLMANAKPVLVDCAPNDFNMSPDETKKKSGRHTKAIIVPHLFGRPADVKTICSIGIPVIEDCAQTLDAQCQGKKAGQWGEMAVCSFYATKLMATGEGGMVLSGRKEYISAINDIINYDEKDDLSPRFNFKMTDLQAAVGRVQLKRLPAFLKRRQAIAQVFTKALSGKPFIPADRLNDRGHVFFRYVVTPVNNIDRKIEKFKKHGIAARKPIYRPLHMYMRLKGFPEAERMWNTSLSLPLYPSLQKDEVGRIAHVAAAVL